MGIYKYKDVMTMKRLIIPGMALIIIVVALISIGARKGAPEQEDEFPDFSGFEEYDKAVFAGGCFWRIESMFEGLEGVAEAASGYTGGDTENPTYKEVSSGKTGHYEAVEVFYDSDEISYSMLLDAYLQSINPTSGGGQFPDMGQQYAPAIFYASEEEKDLAEFALETLELSERFEEPIAVKVLPLETFYYAEEYHQDYYSKKEAYSECCVSNLDGKQSNGVFSTTERKEDTMEKTWNAEFDKTKRLKELTELEYGVTQNEATEPPFNNRYWNNREDGIYVDIVSGEPLFSSTDKYKSGTGWPSFTKPLEAGNIVEKIDTKLFGKRIEIRSRNADSHLGHVFTDGPEPTGLRYCMNSASLRFIPKDKLSEEGYGEYEHIFENK